MADLSRYEIIAGSVIMCRTCRDTENGPVVHAFKGTTLSMDDVETEIEIHENDHHQPDFEDNASEVGLAAKRVARALQDCAEAVEVEVSGDDYFLRGCDPETAYRDGLVDGVGGSTGKMAGLLGPGVAKALAKALTEITEMDGIYDELIQDHNRKTCGDHTCFVFGYLTDIARTVNRQLK